MKKINRWKINLIDLNNNSFLKLISLLKLKSFILNQLFYWIYNKNIVDFNYMKNISFKSLFFLYKICKIEVNSVKKEMISSDNTIKWLISVDCFNFIETVAIPNKKESYTLCVSSQVGCAMNCSFCYTGKQGFVRNMRLGEIISQIIQAKKRINFFFANKKITNIVFMGMGEPLLNINNVLNSIEIIENKFSFNIHKNKITVSTSGIINGIKFLVKKRIPIALSLHSPFNSERSGIMPINKKYSIKNVLSSLKNYDNLTIEYLIIKDLNDSLNHALSLASLLFSFKSKICLIPFNYFFGSNYSAPDIKTLIAFKQILIKHGKVATIRKRFGFDIQAACGQLRGLIKK